MKSVAKSRILVTRFPFHSRWGGEEVHTLRLMEELDKRGMEAFFLGSCPELLKAFAERHFLVRKAWLSKPPVSLLRLLSFTLLSPLLFFLAGFFLYRARKDWAITHVYMLSFGEKLLMTPWALFAGIPVVWVEHARIGRWLTRNPWRILYRRWSHFVTVVVTSQAMVPLLRPWVHRVTAIPCGVMLDKPMPLPPRVKSFLSSGFGVVCVARWTVDKGVDKLVHCVYSKPEIRLVLVGDGPLEADIKKAVHTGRVLALPALSRGELMSLYAEAELFVLPSQEMDPFGMVAAEAMAMGAPVLMTSACGFASELRHGQEAWVVGKGLVELSLGLKRLTKDPALRMQLAKRGKAVVTRHFSLRTMVDRFEWLFKFV